MSVNIPPTRFCEHTYIMHMYTCTEKTMTNSSKTLLRIRNQNDGAKVLLGNQFDFTKAFKSCSKSKRSSKQNVIRLALKPKCLTKNLPLKSKCLNKSVALKPKCPGTVFLPNQNVWTKALLSTKTFENKPSFNPKCLIKILN